MRTKEEILMNIFKQNYTERIFRFQKLVNHDITLKAMQEYADEQSIAFAEWKYKINFHENDSCYDIKNSPTLTDDWWTIKSTSELLQIFKNETI